MTKKSHGRLARDAVKREFQKELTENTNWDDLQARYAECRNLLLMHIGVGNVLEDPAIRAEIKDLGMLVGNIRLLTKDITERAGELEKIYAIHSDKQGGCTEEDIMLSFEVMEKYTQWLALIEAVVMPTVAHILEITSEAEKTLQVKQAQAAAQDPNNHDPIDVAYKTTEGATQSTVSDSQRINIENGIANADHTVQQPE